MLQMITQVLVAMWGILRLCVCAQDSVDARLNFTDGEGAYSIDKLWCFGILDAISLDAERDAVHMSFALDMQKSVFDTTLRLCGEDEIGDLDSNTFYGVLGAAGYLKIVGDGRRSFFANMAQAGLLGAHARDIVGDTDCSHTLPDAVAMPLFKGLAYANGMEVRIVHGKASVCPPGRSYRIYGSLEDDDHAVREMQVISSAETFLHQQGMWDILAWFFAHMQIRILRIDSCRLTHVDVKGITNLQLTVLSVSNCHLEHGSLVILSDPSSIVQNTLVKLDVSYNHFERDDAVALTKLRLRTLYIRSCVWGGDSLACVLAAQGSLRKTLRELVIASTSIATMEMALVSQLKLTKLVILGCGLEKEHIEALVSSGASLKNDLRHLDISFNSEVGSLTALAQLKLVGLNISCCNLRPGFLVSFADDCSAIKGTLRQIRVSGNKLGVEDVKALSWISIEEIEMNCCNLNTASILPLASEDSVLKYSLWKLDIGMNSFDSDCVKVLSKLCLKDLHASRCGLKEGDLASLLQQDAALVHTIHTLDVSWTRLTKNDMDAVSHAELEHLNIFNCSLAPNSLISWGDASSVLLDRLRMLTVSNNPLGPGDVDVIGRMHLRVLEMHGCELGVGSLARLMSGGSPLINTLNRLSASYNKFGCEDIATIAGMHQIKELLISLCEIPPGCFVLFANEYARIRSTLRKLTAVYETAFSAEDSEALRSIPECEIFTLAPGFD